MPILKLQDFNLHYKFLKNSNKPVVIFANSLGTNLQLWDKQVKFL